MGAALFGLGVAIAVIYLPRTNRRESWPRSIRKTLPVALFAIAACVDGGPVLLIAALGLSAIGDFALSRQGERAFLAGMIAFALAHLAYIALMVPLWGMLSTGAVIAAIALIFLSLSSEFWLLPHTGNLKHPVRGYVWIIALMGIAALGLPEQRMLALTGATLFILSDFILSLETFVLPTSHPARWLAGKAVWISYIGAQMMLFLGLVSLS